MKKIVNIRKKNIEIAIGILIGLTFGSIGVIAKTITSKEVSYTNTNSDVTNVQEAVEELYEKLQFKFQVPNLTENGARYTGANPNNYVSFNGELWRIIGVFDGKIKIIKNESIGDYVWDSFNTNDWGNSSLYRYLNTIYYNELNVPYKNMVENATWKTGGWDTANIPTSLMYEYEGRISENTSTITGYIGLMNVSDYGYASSACYNGSKTLYNYTDPTCAGTNWLLGVNEWTLTKNSFYGGIVFSIDIYGYVDSGFGVTSTRAVRPSLYLKSDVTITGGIGTKNNPYNLFLDEQ